MKPIASRTLATVLISIAGLVVIAAATPIHAQTFSVAPAGLGPSGGAWAPSPGGFSPEDLFAPSGLVTPPPSAVLVLPGFGPLPPGPGGGDFVNVDAFSFGRSVAEGPLVAGFEFSVDRLSAGAPGTAVFAESAGFDHVADIFGSAGGGANFLVLDGDGVPTPGPAPSMGLLEIPTSTLSDDTDGWDNRVPGGVLGGPGGGVFFSVDPLSTTVGLGYADPSDIYFGSGIGYNGPGAFVPYAAAAGLGLAAGDDIDALVVFDDGDFVFTPGLDAVLFSLTPGSPTLAALATDAASILGSSGAAVVVAPSAVLGLLPGDNLDALDVVIVPEPASLALFGIGLVMFAVAARRWSKGLKMRW